MPYQSSITHNPDKSRHPLGIEIPRTNTGWPKMDALDELWMFYQFMTDDEELKQRFEKWKTYKLLKMEKYTDAKR